MNPYGAILLAQRFRQETRPKPSYHERWQVETYDLDITHGSVMQRELNLRELVRLWDFRYLSSETKAIDRSQLSLEGLPKETREQIDWLKLDPVQFWNRFSRSLRANRNFDSVSVLSNFLKSKALGLSSEEEAALIVFIHRHILKQEKPFTLTINGQPKLIEKEDTSLFKLEAVERFFAQSVFDKLGLQVLPSDLIALGEVTAKAVFSQEDRSLITCSLDGLAKIRRFTQDFFEKRFGRQIDFMKQWDTILISTLLEMQGIKGQASFHIELRSPIIPGVDSKLDRFVVFDSPIPFSEVESNLVEEVFAKVGCQFVDISIVIDRPMEKLGLAELMVGGLGIPAPYMDMHNARVFRIFAKRLSNALLSVSSRMLSAVSERTTGVLSECELLLQIMGNDYINFVVGSETIEYIRRTIEADPEREIELPSDGLKELAGTELIKLFAQSLPKTTEQMHKLSSNALHQQALDWFKELKEEIGHNKRFARLFSKILLFEMFTKAGGGIEMEPTSIMQEEEGEHISLNEMQCGLLFELYANRGKRLFLDKTNGLIMEMNFRDEEEVLSAIQWIENLVEEKNELRLANPWSFGRDEKAKLTSVMHFVKRDNLEEIRQLPAEEILRQTPEIIEKWPLAWTTIPEEEYRSYWEEISQKTIGYLEAKANALGASSLITTAEEFEQILALSLFSQGSISAMTLASLCLSQLVKRSLDFETAFAYFKKYSFLPRSLLQDAFNILVEEKASEPQQLGELEEWVRANIETMLETKEDLAVAEISQAIFRMVDMDERLQFLIDLLSTNQSDEGLKRYLARKWWEKLPHEYSGSSLDSIAQGLLNVEKEMQNDARLKRIAQEKGRDALKKEITRLKMEFENAMWPLGQPFVEHPIGDYAPFEQLYTSLYRASPVVVYLLLRALVLEGQEGIFRSNEKKEALLRGFLEHYVEIAETNGGVRKAIDSVINALTQKERPSPEDLFYFLGPSLAALALQFPEEEYPTEEIVNMLLGDYLGKKRGEKRSFAEERFKRTHNMLGHRVRSAVFGRLPALVKDASTGDLRLRPVTAVQYTTFEDAALAQLAYLVPKRSILGGKITPLGLAVEIGERMGILGVRLLQLVGLFFELSPEDRQTLSHVYAKVQGQSKLQAFVVLRRETERNEVFRQLFNQIDKIKQMVGGGSIVTVYEVATKDGRRWAVGVKNPNAEFWARELLEFIQSIIQNMIEEDPANPQLQLLNRLLTDAFHWIGDEINDPDYLHKNERFFIHNDYRSQDENRFQASEGISWQIFVPQIQDTQTDWVRWEEFVEGVELVEFMNTEPAEDTDFQKKVLSREDARQVVSLIVQNYAHQLFVTGLVHSDVHPGNFLLTADRKVAILDRKNLLDFASQEEKGLLEELINLIAEADKDKLIDFIARRFIPERGYDPDLLARIKSQMANKFNPEAPEEYIGSLLMASKKEGIEIPLKYLLVLKNILALNRLSQWAGYKNVVDALVSTEVEKGLPGDVSVKLEEGVLEAFTVKIQKDILKKICVFGKAFQQLLAQFTPQLERHVSLDSLKQGIEQITQLGENGIEALGDVDIQIKLDNPQEQKMYARIRDVLQELQLPQGRVTSVAILAKLPNIIRQFRFLEDNPEQQRIFFSLIEKLTKEISEILRNDTTDLTVSKDLASRVAEKTIAASVEGLGAANTATGTASGQTALLITDDAGNAARREIKDILLSATDFGIKDVICLEVSPKGSISDIEAVLNAMGQVTRVFTYFTSAQARDSILSFLSGKALDLSGTSSEDLELKIKEHLASAASAGTSL